MVPTQLYVIALAISFSTETFSKPLSSAAGRFERSDDPQPLAAIVENLANRMARLEASNTEAQNELGVLRAKRCESGVIGFSPHAQDTVVHPDGSQSRTHTIHVNFGRSFPNNPWVSLGMSEVDVYNNANLRISLSVDGITTSGFDAHAYEWADTNVVSVTAFWVACNI